MQSYSLAEEIQMNMGLETSFRYNTKCVVHERKKMDKLDLIKI